MKLEGVTLEGLKMVQVQINGNWIEGSRRDWRGTATSSVPIVGMSFLESGGHCEWCKSERNESTPEIRLALFPYDNVGTDVQVNFSVGEGGRRWRSLLPSPSYLPTLPDSHVLQTANIYRFATIDGNPPVNLFIIFLDRADIESSRKTLWRVRKRFESALRKPFLHLLTYGRTGICEG